MSTAEVRAHKGFPISGPNYFYDFNDIVNNQFCVACVAAPRSAIKGTRNRGDASIAVVPLLSKPQVLRFDDFIEYYWCVDDGNDEYTFDNCWRDGTPKVDHRFNTRRPHVGKKCIATAEILAYRRAQCWCTGSLVDLPAPRIVDYAGRIAQYVENDFDEAADGDIEFEVEFNHADMAKYINYSHKPMAYWGKGKVFWEEFNIDMQKYVTVEGSRKDAMACLGKDWSNYVHRGKIPTRPKVVDGVASNAADLPKVEVGPSIDGGTSAATEATGGAAPPVRGQRIPILMPVWADDVISGKWPPTTSSTCGIAPGSKANKRPKAMIEWFIDSGAAYSLVNTPDFHRIGVGRAPVDPLNIIGVGDGLKPTNTAATLEVDELGVELRPYIVECNFNLLSLGALVKDHKFNFVWLGSEGLDPYLIRPDGKLVALTVEDNIPRFKPGEPVHLPFHPSGWVKIPVPSQCRAFPATAGDAADIHDQHGTKPHGEDGNRTDGDASIAVGPKAKDSKTDGDASVAFGPSAVDSAGAAGDASVAGGPNGKSDNVVIDDVAQLVGAGGVSDSVRAAEFGPAPPVPAGPENKRERDLRKEATSTRHLLRHKPLNPYCEDCCRGKMVEKKHFQGAYKREPKKWGEIITADHLVSTKRQESRRARLQECN